MNLFDLNLFGDGSSCALRDGITSRWYGSRAGRTQKTLTCSTPLTEKLWRVVSWAMTKHEVAIDITRHLANETALGNLSSRSAAVR